MSKSIINDIIDILNNDLSMREKQQSIVLLKKGRHAENKKLLIDIYDMLSEHVLPLHNHEKIHILIGFSDEECGKLKHIIKKSKCTYFNAICGELLWLNKHDINFAKKSLQSYLIELDMPSYDNEYTYTRVIVSICRLYANCKKLEFDYNSFFHKSVEYVKLNYSREGYLILFILNALADCKENAEQLEEAYNDAIVYYENEKRFSKSISFLEGLENLYKNDKRTIDIKNVRKRIAVNHEKSADQYDWNNSDNSHRIIDSIQSAMEMWSKVDDKDSKSERKRLAKKIEHIKELHVQSFQIITSQGIDISKWIELSRKSIENLSLESYLYRLAMLSPLKSYNSMKEEYEQSEFSFTDMFSTIKLDSNGRKKCIIPSALGASNEERYSIIEYKASQYYMLFADVAVKNFIILAKEKFDFTKENLEFLVEDNMFIPSDRKESFLAGIVAGFNLDLVTAMHLLMPQVENSIRCLVQECGAVVYKTEKDGVEKCLSLESILRSDEAIECLDETFLFNLSLFFTSVYGFGMRNEVCHGLYSDKELQSAPSLAVWWFVLRICCMYSRKLYERLNEPEKSKMVDYQHRVKS